MNQHLAPIMNRRPLTAGRHNSRQRLPKPQTVSETPQNEQTRAFAYMWGAGWLRVPE